MAVQSVSWTAQWLGGGLEHDFYDFPFSWECHPPNWRNHIFQRGRSTTNQMIFAWNQVVLSLKTQGVLARPNRLLAFSRVRDYAEGALWSVDLTERWWEDRNLLPRSSLSWFICLDLLGFMEVYGGFTRVYGCLWWYDQLTSRGHHSKAGYWQRFSFRKTSSCGFIHVNHTHKIAYCKINDYIMYLIWCIPPK